MSNRAMSQNGHKTEYSSLNLIIYQVQNHKLVIYFLKSKKSDSRDKDIELERCKNWIGEYSTSQTN